MQLVEFHDTQLDECGTCAGLWVEIETFERLVAESGRRAPALEPHTRAGTGTPAHGMERVRYTRCPQCEKMMNRVNFGRMSGIIIDRCAKHGVWFDAEELRQVLEFVRNGGLEIARQREIRTLAEERYLHLWRQGLNPHLHSREAREHDGDFMNSKSLLSFLLNLHNER